MSSLQGRVYGPINQYAHKIEKHLLLRYRRGNVTQPYRLGTAGNKS